MMCDVCSKKKATVHLTEIVDEQMSELHLCETCAREKSVQMEQQFGLADLLAGLADFGKPAQDVETKLVCPNCGLSYDNFKKFGRLGCSECYVAFRENLAQLLKKIHGSNQHYGKTLVLVNPPENPTAKKDDTQPNLQTLKDQLQKAIQAENFEEAAKIRDQIRILEKGKTE